jgi:hypothetical protein
MDPFIDKDVADREHYRQVKATGKSLVGKAVKSKIDGMPITVIAAPILGSGNGNFLGMMGLILKLDFLSKNLNQWPKFCRKARRRSVDLFARFWCGKILTVF